MPAWAKPPSRPLNRGVFRAIFIVFSQGGSVSAVPAPHQVVGDLVNILGSVLDHNKENQKADNGSPSIKPEDEKAGGARAHAPPELEANWETNDNDAKWVQNHHLHEVCDVYVLSEVEAAAQLRKIKESDPVEPEQEQPPGPEKTTAVSDISDSEVFEEYVADDRMATAEGLPKEGTVSKTEPDAVRTAWFGRWMRTAAETAGKKLADIGGVFSGMMRRSGEPALYESMFGVPAASLTAWWKPGAGNPGLYRDGRLRWTQRAEGGVHASTTYDCMLADCTLTSSARSFFAPYFHCTTINPGVTGSADKQDDVGASRKGCPAVVWVKDLCLAYTKSYAPLQASALGGEKRLLPLPGEKAPLAEPPGSGAVRVKSFSHGPSITEEWTCEWVWRHHGTTGSATDDSSSVDPSHACYSTSDSSENSALLLEGPVSGRAQETAKLTLQFANTPPARGTYFALQIARVRPQTDAKKFSAPPTFIVDVRPLGSTLSAPTDQREPFARLFSVQSAGLSEDAEKNTEFVHLCEGRFGAGGMEIRVELLDGDASVLENPKLVEVPATAAPLDCARLRRVGTTELQGSTSSAPAEPEAETEPEAQQELGVGGRLALDTVLAGYPVCVNGKSGTCQYRGHVTEGRLVLPPQEHQYEEKRAQTLLLERTCEYRIFMCDTAKLLGILWDTGMSCLFHLIRQENDVAEPSSGPTCPKDISFASASAATPPDAQVMAAKEGSDVALPQRHHDANAYVFLQFEKRHSFQDWSQYLITQLPKSWGTGGPAKTLYDACGSQKRCPVECLRTLAVAETKGKLSKASARERADSMGMPNGDGDAVKVDDLDAQLRQHCTYGCCQNELFRSHFARDCKKFRFVDRMAVTTMKSWKASYGLKEQLQNSFFVVVKVADAMQLHIKDPIWWVVIGFTMSMMDWVFAHSDADALHYSLFWTPWGAWDLVPDLPNGLAFQVEKAADEGKNEPSAGCKLAMGALMVFVPSVTRNFGVIFGKIMMLSVLGAGAYSGKDAGVQGAGWQAAAAFSLNERIHNFFGFVVELLQKGVTNVSEFLGTKLDAVLPPGTTDFLGAGLASVGNFLKPLMTVLEAVCTFFVDLLAEIRDTLRAFELEPDLLRQKLGEHVMNAMGAVGNQVWTLIAFVSDRPAELVLGVSGLDGVWEKVMDTVKEFPLASLLSGGDMDLDVHADLRAKVLLSLGGVVNNAVEATDSVLAYVAAALGWLSSALGQLLTVLWGPLIGGLTWNVENILGGQTHERFHQSLKERGGADRRMTKWFCDSSQPHQEKDGPAEPRGASSSFSVQSMFHRARNLIREKREASVRELVAAVREEEPDEEEEVAQEVIKALDKFRNSIKTEKGKAEMADKLIGEITEELKKVEELQGPPNANTKPNQEKGKPAPEADPAASPTAREVKVQDAGSFLEQHEHTTGTGFPRTPAAMMIRKSMAKFFEALEAEAENSAARSSFLQLFGSRSRAEVWFGNPAPGFLAPSGSRSGIFAKMAQTGLEPEYDSVRELAVRQATEEHRALLEQHFQEESKALYFERRDHESFEVDAKDGDEQRVV